MTRQQPNQDRFQPVECPRRPWANASGSKRYTHAYVIDREHPVILDGLPYEIDGKPQYQIVCWCATWIDAALLSRVLNSSSHPWESDRAWGTNEGTSLTDTEDDNIVSRYLPNRTEQGAVIIDMTRPLYGLDGQPFEIDGHEQYHALGYYPKYEDAALVAKAMNRDFAINNMQYRWPDQNTRRP